MAGICVISYTDVGTVMLEIVNGGVVVDRIEVDKISFKNGEKDEDTGKYSRCSEVVADEQFSHKGDDVRSPCVEGGGVVHRDGGDPKQIEGREGLGTGEMQEYERVLRKRDESFLYSGDQNDDDLGQSGW